MSAELKPNGVHPGLYPDLSNDAYHASPGISCSGLKDIYRSPRHYYAWHLDPKRPPRPEKAGQLEGNLLHCALLEPDEFQKRYVVGPTINRNMKTWKDWVAHNTQGGRIPIQGDQYETAMRQADAARALPDIAPAVARGQAEVAAYWNDPETGVLCRCKADFAHNAGSGYVLLDAKTYSDASPDDFARQVARKLYHMQDQWYSDGFALASGAPVLAFVFIAIETEHPYAATAIMLDEPSRSSGRALYRRLLNTYADCLKLNDWPDYGSAIQLVSIPRYAMENQGGY